jgi:rod shape-determining protein MreB
MIEVKGRCLMRGLPRVVRISSLEMSDALEEPIHAIIGSVCSVIEQTPPELIGDILNHGIVMTGGGSLLYGLDRLIANVTHIRTRVADHPISCVAIGTGKSLDHISVIPEGAINISRQRMERP